MKEKEEESKKEEITKHLQSGEKLLWSERPRSWRMILWPSLVAVPFSTAQLFFGIWWTTETLRLQGQDPANKFLWVVLIAGWLIAMGGAGGFLAPLMSWITVRRTIYAITDKRVIVFQGNSWPRKVKSYSQIKPASQEQSDTSGGDILFVADEDSEQESALIRLEGISDVASVEQLILRIHKASLSPN